MGLLSLKVPSGCAYRQLEKRMLSVIGMMGHRGTFFGCFNFQRRKATNQSPPAPVSVRKRPWDRPVKRRLKICDTERTAWQTLATALDGVQ